MSLTKERVARSDAGLVSQSWKSAGGAFPLSICVPSLDPGAVKKSRKRERGGRFCCRYGLVVGKTLARDSD